MEKHFVLCGGLAAVSYTFFSFYALAWVSERFLESFCTSVIASHTVIGVVVLLFLTAIAAIIVELLGGLVYRVVIRVCNYFVFGIPVLNLVYGWLYDDML